MSKSIAATYFVMLDERGVVSLDDPVEKFLPELKGVRLRGGGEAKAKMRVWHLLSHRSGLPGNADLGTERPGLAPGGRGATLESVVRGWITDGLFAEPGARFAYGGAGYMMAARVAEVALGRRFERQLEEALLEPLGMTHTTFFPDDAMLRAMPARYLPGPGGLRRDAREKPLPAPGGLVNPGGGLVSRLDDMTKYLALHAHGGVVDGKRLVKAESLARMYRPHPPRATEAAEGGGNGYGLGWNVLAPGGVARHLGATGTLAWIDLKHGHAGVLLTQVKWGANRAIIPRLMKQVQAIFPSAAVSAGKS